MTTSSSISIRPATVADAQSIACVHVASWLSTYRGLIPDAHLDSLSVEHRTESWAAQLAEMHLPMCAFVADDNGTIVGFANGGSAREQDPVYTGEVYAIYLLADYQGRGLGRTLFTHVTHSNAIAGLSGLLVWVLATNPARRFYEHLGGQLVRSKSEEIGGVALEEVAYGWTDVSQLVSRPS